MLGYGEVDGEEPWGEGGAECVAVHQGNLGAHGLVLEEMLPRGDHIRQDLLVGLRNIRDRVTCDLC